MRHTLMNNLYIYDKYIFISTFSRYFTKYLFFYWLTDV